MSVFGNRRYFSSNSIGWDDPAPRPLGLENRSLGGLLACQERLAEQAKRGNEDNTARGEK
jgi:hypothetical protein